MKTITIVQEYEVKINNEAHCSNDCEHIQVTCGEEPQEFRAQCSLFDAGLIWDRRYTHNGYQRCQACLDAEASGRKK